MNTFVKKFLTFGLMQANACMFGGSMLFLLIFTKYFYPFTDILSRYDFLFLAALTLQIIFVITKLETWEELKIICIFHIAGTLMEIFKISVGSWVYPEPSIFNIYNVPLFSGFMYASIGSYIVRSWKLFDFKFSNYPPVWSFVLLGIFVYINFFTHHYFYDFRYILMFINILLFTRCTIYFKLNINYHSMPILLAQALMAFFVWIAENIGTFTQTWIYSNNLLSGKWSVVSLGKYGSWFLLLTLSYSLVLLIKKPKIYE